MNEQAIVYDIRTATADDIPGLLALQAENQISRGGALSIEFPATWFADVICDMPIVTAWREHRLVGFLVSSPKRATQYHPLGQAKFSAYPAEPNAYNSGPPSGPSSIIYLTWVILPSQAGARSRVRSLRPTNRSGPAHSTARGRERSGLIPERLLRAQARCTGQRCRGSRGGRDRARGCALPPGSGRGCWVRVLGPRRAIHDFGRRCTRRPRPVGADHTGALSQVGLGPSASVGTHAHRAPSRSFAG